MRFETDGIKCSIRSSGNGGPIVYACVFPDQNEDELFETVEKRSAGDPFTLVCFVPNDWRRECVPWDAEIGETVWNGAAREFLQKLENRVIPYVRKTVNGESRSLIAGYSMAGLFALWVMYASNEFSGAACCSGSLWYPGWDTFAAENRIHRQGSMVYLSIGGKETKGAPEYMMCNDKRMREQLELLRRDENVRRCTLEMNAGGHFANPNGRMAKGIVWLMRQTKP